MIQPIYLQPNVDFDEAETVWINERLTPVPTNPSFEKIRIEKSANIPHKYIFVTPIASAVLKMSAQFSANWYSSDFLAASKMACTPGPASQPMNPAGMWALCADVTNPLARRWRRRNKACRSSVDTSGGRTGSLDAICTEYGNRWRYFIYRMRARQSTSGTGEENSPTSRSG